MDDDDSHQLAKANLSVDDIVQKEVTNTETNKFVCIEELSNENIRNEEALERLDNANENLNYANKFEVVHGLPFDKTAKNIASANKDIGINIPIHIINQELQSPVEDIQNNNIIETTTLPTISPSVPFVQGRVSKLHYIVI